MIRKAWIVIAAGFFGLFLGGCTWETGNELPDGGDPVDGQDGGNDGGADEQEPQYPQGPYGVDYMDTVENFQYERVVCQGDTGTGVAAEVGELLGSKAILVSVHAGWCSVCKVQSQTMHDDMIVPYGDRGLSVLLVLFQDDKGSEDRAKLLDYACYYKEHYGLDGIHVVIDPGAASTSQFFRPTEAGTPLNMILDKDFRIRFKVEGLYPDAKIMEGTIEGLLGE